MAGDGYLGPDPDRGYERCGGQDGVHGPVLVAGEGHLVPDRQRLGDPGGPHGFVGVGGDEIEVLVGRGHVGHRSGSLGGKAALENDPLENDPLLAFCFF